MDNKEKSLKIGNRVLTEREIFVIAEIGVNHNGSMNKAFKLIDQAKSSGADCVKFQFRCLNETYSKDALKLTTADLGAQYTIGLLKKFNLTFNQIIIYFHSFQIFKILYIIFTLSIHFI